MIDRRSFILRSLKFLIAAPLVGPTLLSMGKRAVVQEIMDPDLFYDIFEAPFEMWFELAVRHPRSHFVLTGIGEEP